MSLLTNFGYTLTEVDTMPNIINATEYSDYTADKYVGDARIEPNLSAVSTAIRNYCGWHLYPSEECKWSGILIDKRVCIVDNNNLMIQLPAQYVSEIKSVTIDGAEYTSFAMEVSGVLRVFNVCLAGAKPYSQIEVVYTAGLPENLMNAVKELAAYRVTHALASSGGITSEASGGVSITYNAGWVNSARSTALPSDNKEVLEPYRLKGVF